MPRGPGVTGISPPSWMPAGSGIMGLRPESSELDACWLAASKPVSSLYISQMRKSRPGRLNDLPEVTECFCVGCSLAMSLAGYLVDVPVSLDRKSVV